MKQLHNIRKHIYPDVRFNIRKTLGLMGLLTLAAVAPCFTSCNRDTKSSDATEQGAPQESPVVLDIDKLNELKSKSSKDMTPEDYDFLLDQVELIIKPTIGMSEKERHAYIDKLDKDTQGYLILMGLSIAAAKDQGRLTREQTERFMDMEKRYK